MCIPCLDFEAIMSGTVLVDERYTSLPENTRCNAEAIFVCSSTTPLKYTTFPPILVFDLFI